MSDVSEQLWVEKYRPEKLDDIVGHETIVQRMEDWVDDNTVPHLLFAGPQGVGKTAIITAYARQKYGEEAWRNNVMQLNASDERGIDTVREKVKTFARQSTAVGGGDKRKLIFLDECDQMSSSAQPALRRVMEDYSDKTIFALSCNYLNKIIQPLQSRCAVFNVGSLDDNQIKSLCEDVAEKEDLEYEENVLWDIVESSRGDARAAINTLQAAEMDGEVTKETAGSVVSVVSDDLVEELVDEAIQGEFETAMERLDKEVLKQGVDPQTLCDSFLRVVKDYDDLPPDAKIKALDKVGETDWRILQGANPSVHFHKLLADLHICRHLSLDNYTRSDM